MEQYKIIEISPSRWEVELRCGDIEVIVYTSGGRVEAELVGMEIIKAVKRVKTEPLSISRAVETI